MPHFNRMCKMEIPANVLHAVLLFAIETNDELKQDSEAIGCVIKAQIDKFGCINGIKEFISSLPKNKQDFANKRVFEYVNQPCKYTFD